MKDDLEPKDPLYLIAFSTNSNRYVFNAPDVVHRDGSGHRRLYADLHREDSLCSRAEVPEEVSQQRPVFVDFEQRPQTPAYRIFNRSQVLR